MDYIYIDRYGHSITNDSQPTPAAARRQAEALAVEHRTTVTLAEVVDYDITVNCVICNANLTRHEGRNGDAGPLCLDCYNAINHPDDADIESLAGILDQVGVPTHQYRQPLSFHQRVAVLAGMYEGALKEFGAALRFGG